MFSFAKSNGGVVVASVITIAAVIATLVRLSDGTASGPSAGEPALAAAEGSPSAQMMSPSSGIAVADGSGNLPIHSPSATPSPGVATPPPSPCGSANFAFTLVTDKSVYHKGETVWASMAATYTGTRCAYGGECIPVGLVRDGAQHETE